MEVFILSSPITLDFIIKPPGKDAFFETEGATRAAHDDKRDFLKNKVASKLAKRR